MKRTMLAGACATLTVLAVALGACGADGNPLEEGSGDDESATATTRPEASTPEVTDRSSPDVTFPELSMPDLSVPGLPDFTMPDFTMPDFSMPDFTMPDFSIPELPDLPAVSLPADRLESFEEMIRRMWPNLDDEQVSCLAEGVFELTPGNVFDTNIFEECGIDPEDLGG